MSIEEGLVSRKDKEDITVSVLGITKSQTRIGVNSPRHISAT